MSFWSTMRKWLSGDPIGHVPDITADQAAHIKLLYEGGEFTQKQIGKMFGVHQSQISRILASFRRQ